ncbi:MAG: tetratricopeptide repeat protein [Nitrospina sp.]|jgi:tetratricopeptide (TPR) repeat protein|nr:tetratricopeptide repeat protein [Nitrospina sp.]MBT3416044.1 tetratricopeptide repeat protein [Nitrospina sp.]MBT4104083.1 tetratricopeptide repeat protein [Nitrospina sp.]MBT4389485.1 tetratricopeptide repeat protein [Nitrospina sp.]MBT5260159.1 tetratricopeptide repeat protein [Nitrospina sp.]
MRNFLNILVAILFFGCANVPAPINSHFNKGVEHYDNQDYAKAIEEYKLALRQNTNDTFAMYNLAVVYQDQGKTDQAEKLYQDVLKIIEDSFSRINLAGIFYNKGNHEEAFEQLETAANKNPDSAYPLSALGEFKEREGKLAEAEKNYLKALSIDNRHALTHYRLGRLHLKQEKFATGVEHLRQASDLETENPAYLETLGAEYERSGDYLEAVNFFERVSVLEPDRLDVYVKLGDLYKKKTMFKEALSRYWSALALKNDDPYIHRSILEIYKILSEHEKEQLKTLEGQSSFARTP